MCSLNCIFNKMDSDSSIYESNLRLSDFPVHIISKILSFLPIRDILNASLTCSLWFEASLHKDVTRKFTLKINKSKFSSTDTKFTEILNGTRNFAKIVFEFVDFIDYFKEFWQRFGKYIEDINFDMCEIDQDKFFTILQYLTHLKVLRIKHTTKVIYTNELFDQKSDIEKNLIQKTLRNINSLILENIENLTEIFLKFLSYTINLRTFKIYQYSRMLDTQLMIKFCKQNEKTLKYLLIKSYTLKKEEFLIGLIKLDQLKLRHFEIELHECSNETFQNFFMRQHLIESLDAQGLNNEKMKIICKYLRNLKYLKTDNCYEVESSLADINELTEMKVLILSGVGNESDEVLLNMLKDKKLSMEVLQLCHPITNESITKITESYPNLQILNLRFMHPIPQRGAQMIFQNLIHLKSLHLVKHAFGNENLDDVAAIILYNIQYSIQYYSNV